MGSEAAPEGHLVAHAAGIRVPLIFLQTWPEERDAFVPFLGAVHEDQPVFALLAPPRDVAARLDTVDDWVSLLLPQVRALPVEPPYQLAGWSFGGVVALELARRLHDGGVAVTPVHLIDTWLPRPRRAAPAAASLGGSASSVARPGPSGRATCATSDCGSPSGSTCGDPRRRSLPGRWIRGSGRSGCRT